MFTLLTTYDKIILEIGQCNDGTVTQSKLCENCFIIKKQHFFLDKTEQQKPTNNNSVIQQTVFQDIWTKSVFWGVLKGLELKKRAKQDSSNI